MALVSLANVSPPDIQSNSAHTPTALNASFTKIAGTGQVNATARTTPTGANGNITKAQMRPYWVAERNALDAQSLISTADKALDDMGNQLSCMRTLVEAGTSDSLSPTDVGKLQREYCAAQSKLDQIKRSTTYDGTDLLSSKAQPVSFQVGLPGAANSQLQVDLSEFEWTAPPVTSVGTGNSDSARAAFSSIDDAMRTVSTRRAGLGAVSNQLSTITQNIQTQRLNLTATNSSVRDASVAEEMANLTRSQLLRQPGVSVLSQANQLPQMSLNLLK